MEEKIAPSGSMRFASRARRRLLIRGVLLASDLITLAAATGLATFLRFGRVRHVQAVPQLGPGFNFQFVDLSLVILVIWIIAMWLEHLYDLDRVFWGTGEYARVFRALSFGIVVFIIATYLLHVPEISRGWTVLAWALGIVFAIVGRALVRAGLRLARRRGYLLRPTLVVGYNDEAAELIRRLFSDTSSGLVPVACLASSHLARLEMNSCAEDVPCIGSAGEIKHILDSMFVDTVLVTSTAFDPDILSRIITDMRGRDLDIELSSGLLDVTTSRVFIREVSGVPLITIRGVSFTPWQHFLKRTFDLVGGGLIVVVGLPIWLLIALLVKLESPGPVLYSQTRIGRGGEPFEMMKYRSMSADAHTRRLEVADGNEASGPLFKIRDDPRVTRVGKWLRKFSIDEVPQLINVMKGDMSLCGPRPPLPEETAEYTNYHWRRMEVVPGMTGLWQVSGRSRLTFDEMIRLDLFYIENWSVGFDLSIIARTIPAVLFARGSY